MTGPVPWIAGELIEEGLCSARCLLALGDGPCDCACDGRWHGALTGADAGEGISPEQRAREREQAREQVVRERSTAREQAALERRAEREQAARERRAERASQPRRRGRPPAPPEWPPGARDYPGAPHDDPSAFQLHRVDGKPRLVAVGRNLGKHADILVLDALRAVPEGSPIRVIAREANRIKASRSALAGIRYLSVETCRRALLDLAAAGRLPDGGPAE